MRNNFTRVPNNAERIAEEISHQFNVRAVADDGSVIVEVPGSESAVRSLCRRIDSIFGARRIGDGGQEGDIFINGVDSDIHEELALLAY